LLASGVQNFLNDVSAELSFGNRFDKISGKLCGQKRLELELLHLTLQLLRALLGFLLEGFDLSLHAGDRFLTLG
jgi:hypothetical protein